MRFRCGLSAEAIAKALAPVMYDATYEYQVPKGVPFLTEAGWWELSNANDHKLDVVGDNEFYFRDRYRDSARRQRVIDVLDGLGAELLDVAPIERLARAHTPEKA